MEDPNSQRPGPRPEASDAMETIEVDRVHIIFIYIYIYIYIYITLHIHDMYVYVDIRMHGSLSLSLYIYVCTYVIRQHVLNPCYVLTVKASTMMNEKTR